MKSLATVLLAVTLSGCSFIWPIDHDAVIFGKAVEMKLAIDKVNCEDKNWQELFDSVYYAELYTTLREDPQAENIKQLKESLIKANESKSKVFCEANLKLQKTRIDVITNAWRGR